MSDTVEYVIRLKDQLSSGLDKAKVSADHLNESMNHAQEAAKLLVEAFAIEKVVEFGKASFEAFEKAQASAVRLGAAVEAVGGNAESIKELREQAEALEQTGIFSHVATEQAQTMALQFGLSTEQVHKSMASIEDFAAATHMSLEEAEHAVLLGVNGMGRGLKAHGIELHHTGDRTKDLLDITSQLQNRFEGMGSVIASTTVEGKMAQFENRIESIKERIGKHLAEAFMKVMPYVEKFINGISTVVSFLEEHKDILLVVAAAIGSVAAAMLTVTIATKAWAIAQGILNAVLELNPYIAIATAIIAIGGAIYEAYQRFEKFRAIMDGLGAVIMKGIFPIFKALGEVIAGLFNPSMIAKGANDMISALKNIGQSGGLTGIFATGYMDSIRESRAMKAAEANAPKVKAAHGVAGAIPSDSTGGKGGTIVGNKSLVITFNIKEFGKIDIHNSNLTGSATQIKQQITRAMLEAVNDGQVAFNGL